MKKWPLKLINYLTGCLLLSSLHCMIAAVVKHADIKTFIGSLAYLPVVILLSEGQKRAKYFWQFLICGSAAFGLLYLSNGQGFERTLSLVLAAAAFFSFFYARASKKSCWLEEPVYPFLALYVIMFLLQIRYRSDLLRNYAVYGAAVCYLLCMYKTNLDEMHLVFHDGARLERFPKKRLFQSNLVMMGAQTVIVMAGMAAAILWGVDGALSNFLHMTRNAVARLLGGLESEEQVWGTEAVSGELQPAIEETKELSGFMEGILRFGEFLGWILVIGITLYVALLVLKKLYELYLAFDMNSAENGDKIEQLYEAGSREEKKLLKKEKKEKVFWDRSTNARIRKRYKKCVLKASKEMPEAFMTPAEIESRLTIGEDEKEMLHTCYEKARYSMEKCTKEEAADYHNLTLTFRL